MSFKIGDWVMTSEGARQVDGITPGGQVKVGRDRYKPDVYAIRQGRKPTYYKIGRLYLGGLPPSLRIATEAEIAARKLEIEAQLEREQIQKARAKLARDFLRSFDWNAVSDYSVLSIAEARGFKG